MREALAGLWNPEPRQLRTIALVVLLAPLCFMLVAIGRLTTDRPLMVVAGAAGLILIALVMTDPLSVVALVVPGVWVVLRVSGGGIDMSGSDALLVLGTVCAVPFVPWQNRRLGRILLAVLVFEALLLMSVIAHPSARGLFEWGHRLFLTGGSVIVGSALFATGAYRRALAAFVAVAAVVGPIAAVDSARQGFGAAYVLGFHKNFIGSLMLVVLAVTYLAPAAISWSKRTLILIKIAAALGLLASQSRGAILALVIGLVVACVNSRAIRRQAKPLIVLLIPLALFAALSLRDQLNGTDSGHSSITERARYREQAMEAWRASPALGQGMRFFKSGDFELKSDPHNVIVASLSETGVVGLVALLGLITTAVAVLWPVRKPLAVAALAVLVGRFAHGVFDIYWVAATQTLPWLVVGMAVGDQTPVRTNSDAAAELVHV